MGSDGRVLTRRDVSGVSTKALAEKAVAARRAERWEEAVMCCDAVLERLRASPRDAPEIEAGAMYPKAVCLHKEGYARATVAAYDSLIARYALSNEPRTVGLVADALWIQARARFVR